MAWIAVHQSIVGPKLRKFRKALECSQWEAEGILVSLWMWGLDNADKYGLIPYADRADIEAALAGSALGSTLSLSSIVDALISCGWIDECENGIYLHDWEEWQDQWYKARERREADTKRKRENRNKKKVIDLDEITFEGFDDEEHDNDSGSQPDATKKSGENNEYSLSFIQFWEAYPRKADKGMAYKKYQARLNDGFTEEQLLEAAKEYAIQCKRCGTEQKYIKHPKTFLGDSTPFTEFLSSTLKESTVQDSNGNPFFGD